MKTQEKRPLGLFTQRTTCRFCESTDLVKVLDFGNVPLAGGFLKDTEFSEEKFYPLELNFCRKCCLLQVSNVVPGEVLFKNYFYFSSAIRTLVDHLADFARETTERFLKDRKNPSVFEIGCNDGVMLKPFAQLGVKAVGVDPATNVVKSIESKDITVINDFFCEAVGERISREFGRFDAITSSYSFAHIDDMISVIKGVKKLLKDDGVFIFEVYYLGTLIEEMQYDMIYHEHMSYYSLKALDHFLGTYGMEMFDTKFTPGVRSGAVRFYARNKGKRTDAVSPAVEKMRADEIKRGYDKAETFLGYGDKVKGTRTALMRVLNDLKSRGKTIIGYGASGRGTTIMNFCGIDGKYLDYVVDDAPAKHGFYTPGTHVAIKPWDAVTQGAFPEYALLFAWSFINEVKKRRVDYLEQGGSFIVPLPEVSIVGK
ncbi:MAG TPA: class I SAM-dependent methyltransferase [Candidatus Omnitrophota bacterium]|nr:class I SAM-dependent methyltransferase [Candidatus Omnitrophota bacterium]HRZ15830.1 class I SAM-dependent methyltransferase [Candidatus Omnitrophota bacterium]